MQKQKYLGHLELGNPAENEKERGEERGHLAPGEQTHTHAHTRAHLQFSINSCIARTDTDGHMSPGGAAGLRRGRTRSALADLVFVLLNEDKHWLDLRAERKPPSRAGTEHAQNGPKFL